MRGNWQKKKNRANKGNINCGFFLSFERSVNFVPVVSEVRNLCVLEMAPYDRSHSCMKIFLMPSRGDWLLFFEQFCFKVSFWANGDSNKIIYSLGTGLPICVYWASICTLTCRCSPTPPSHYPIYFPASLVSPRQPLKKRVSHRCCGGFHFPFLACRIEILVQLRFPALENTA